jgi:hypothetical protein
MFAPLVDFFTGRTSAWKAKYEAAFVILVNPNTGVPYVAGGGGGGGGTLADVVLQDANGVLVLQRDDGTTLSYIRQSTGLAFTPVLPLTSPTTPVTGPLTDAQLRATAVPVEPDNVDIVFRDAFEAYTPGVIWNQTLGSGDLIYVDGNTASASYLVISKSPLVANTVSSITSINLATLPVEFDFGLGMSQRTLGQEFAVEVVDSGTPIPDVPDVAISSITQALSVLTVDTTTAHNLVVGKCIGITGCSNPIANYPSLVVATTPSPTQFTCTAGPMGTITSQTITNPAGAKGSVYFRQRLGLAQNGMSEIFEQATVTQASLYIRSEAGDSLPSGTIAGNQSVTVGTTASVQLVNAPYNYSFTPTSEYRIFAQSDRVQWADSAIDALGQTTSRLLRTQVCPDPSVSYAVRVRATNNKALTVPNAQIVSAVKSGTTTATITTNVAHGLATTDVVTIYGIRDQAATAFPNLVTATAVASIVSSTVFTIVIGTASTVTSYGGLVARVNGGNLPSALGYSAVIAQSATLSTLSDGTRQLVLVGNTTWGLTTIGDLVELVGVRNNVDGTSLGVDGAWKIANAVTTSLTLVLPYAGSMVIPADFASTNCGGAVIKRTDMRISFMRMFDYTRERVEMLPRPLNDMSAAAPVVIQGGTLPAVTTVTTVSGVTTVSSITSANLALPGIIADVASAALATTTTTAALTPTFGIGYEVNIPVTVVTGTTPTLDVSIEESDDTGTNWFKVYDFPRITAVGIYRSPVLPITGNRIRYVQTVGGTTPSFTRAINRLQSSYPAPFQRQLIDRSISLTTANSTTTTITSADCLSASQLMINVGAITTTAPQLQLEGSNDFGTSWFSIGSPLTAVANSTVQTTVADINAGLLRARVSTVGSGVTAGYVLIKAYSS